MEGFGAGFGAAASGLPDSRCACTDHAGLLDVVVAYLYVLLNPLRGFTIVKVPSGRAVTLSQYAGV